MKQIINNKKGEFLLRHVMILFIVFASVMGLTALFVENMADTYDDDAMVAEFTGNEFYTASMNQSDKTVSVVDGMAGDTDLEQIGILVYLSKAGSIIGRVLFAPTYFSGIVTEMLSAINVPDKVTSFINIMIQTLLYALLIFLIYNALTGGGKA